MEVEPDDMLFHSETDERFPRYPALIPLISLQGINVGWITGCPPGNQETYQYQYPSPITAFSAPKTPF
jgi:hypothetical protein